MPMIDVYATAGTFDDTKGLAQQLAAAALMRVEQVPDISSALHGPSSASKPRAIVPTMRGTQ